jgi:hypothetical protein
MQVRDEVGKAEVLHMEEGLEGLKLKQTHCQKRQEEVAEILMQHGLVQLPSTTPFCQLESGLFLT